MFSVLTFISISYCSSTMLIVPQNNTINLYIGFDTIINSNMSILMYTKEVVKDDEYGGDLKLYHRRFSKDRAFKNNYYFIDIDKTQGKMVKKLLDKFSSKDGNQMALHTKFLQSKIILKASFEYKENTKYLIDVFISRRNYEVDFVMSSDKLDFTKNIHFQELDWAFTDNKIQEFAKLTDFKKMFIENSCKVNFFIREPLVEQPEQPRNDRLIDGIFDHFHCRMS